jgi:catechol 2,3-dioxygenase-like lactoylglutathione lyase family enzyme
MEETVFIIRAYTSAMNILGIDHINIAATEAVVERCRRFYVDVLGLTDGYRPPFTSRGFWLYAGDRPIVHLTERHSAGGGGSAVNHYAFTCQGLEEVIERLNAHAIPFRRDDVPASNTVQLFVEDPAGVRIELNFAAR